MDKGKRRSKSIDPHIPDNAEDMPRECRIIHSHSNFQDRIRPRPVYTGLARPICLLQFVRLFGPTQTQTPVLSLFHFYTASTTRRSPLSPMSISITTDPLIANTAMIIMHEDTTTSKEKKLPAAVPFHSLL